MTLRFGDASLEERRFGRASFEARLAAGTSG